MSAPLPRSNPEAQGVSPAAVTAFIDAIEAAGLELHSFMMLRHGQVVAEGWWKPYAMDLPHMLFSLSKSFTSTAVGFAITEGLLSLDDQVLSFFKDEAPENPSSNWRELKVRHLLTMSTGHAVDTTDFMRARSDGNWAKGFLSRPIKYKPGTFFLYNTGATYMLSAIIQRISGQRVLDYLTPRLFKPLGIEGAQWEQCPMGVNTGGFGLSVKTEDIAKFGQFLLQRGCWQGKQLLPAEWVDEATAKQVENGPTNSTSDWGVGYGYQFWRCTPGCYRGDGAFGQFCIVAPELDAVFAITGGLGDMGAVLQHVWNILLPAIGEKQPENLPARKAMEARLTGLHYDAPSIQAASPIEEEISGRTFKFESRPDRINSVKYLFSADCCEVVTTSSKGKLSQDYGGGYSKGGITSVAFGRGEWIEGICEAPQGKANAASSFTWQDDATVVFTTRLVNRPFVMTEVIRFSENELESKQSINVNFGPTEMPAVKGKLG